VELTCLVLADASERPATKRNTREHSGREPMPSVKVFGERSVATEEKR
jgi:hypothetical protein